MPLPRTGRPKNGLRGRRTPRQRGTRRIRSPVWRSEEGCRRRSGRRKRRKRAETMLRRRELPRSTNRAGFSGGSSPGCP
eukprot:6799603-Pyramimonas_sp.AAC.2